jgi:Spy/CpxP family protein refolding chaperone
VILSYVFTNQKSYGGDMKRRVYLSLLVAGLTAVFAACSRTDEVVGPTNQEEAISIVDFNVVALASFDSGDLTPEQRQKLEAAMKRYHEAVQAIMERVKSGSITREQARIQLQELERQLDEEIKSILTPEQYERWKQHQQFVRDHRGIPYPLPFPLERLALVLNLSADQVEAAKAIIEQAQKDIRAAVESIKDPVELRKAITEILQRADSQFVAILTAEQAAKYEEIKERLHQPTIPYPLFAPLERLAIALGLSPDQIQQAKAIVEQAQKDLRAAMDTITDPAELRTAIQGILKRADEQFRAILTAEQLEKYEQLKRGMHQVRPPYPLPFPLEILAQRLQLTNEQIEKAKAIVEAAAQEIKTAVETIQDPTELRQTIQQILVRADREFRSILTEEQAAIYDQMKHRRRGTEG